MSSAVTRLLDRCPAEGRVRLRHACAFGKEHLHALTRRSGERYDEHCVEVALALAESTHDPSLLCVAVLHDLLVHPDGDALLLGAPLTAEEKKLVEKLHPLRRLHIDANTEDLHRVIDAFTEDPKLLPLRMAHRLNDVRHINRFDLTLTRNIAKETLHMYTAIAGRLGLHAWRHEMEDACFQIVQPKIATTMLKKMNAAKEVDDACLMHTSRFLLKSLKAQGITANVEMRKKSLYSSYRKMAIKKRRFEELTDRLAVRIVVRETSDCYLALGVVHAVFHPIPGKLKDYIGAPKENGYRSIHTVIYPLPGVTEQPMEIQIRTQAMHEECEYGAMKHGEYKNALYALDARSSRVNLLRSLSLLKEEARTPSQFTEALRTYFRDDHIALFDAKNTLYHMKDPVSALDFVCHVYGKRVVRLKSVAINGRVRPMDTKLSDGDTVEAKFGKEWKLKKNWGECCRQKKNRMMLQKLLKASHS